MNTRIVLDSAHFESRTSTQLKEKEEQSSRAIAAQAGELEALKAAVTVYISQTRPQPRPLPSIDDIVASCKPQLLHAIREDIQPLLEDMKVAVQSMLKTQSTELCNVVLTKLASTLQTIKTVAGYIESVKQNGAPTPAVTAIVPQKAAQAEQSSPS